MNRLVRASVEALAGYVPGEQPKDAGIVKLNTNENPYPASPRVAEVLAGFDPSRLRCYPDPLCNDLRRKMGEVCGCEPASVFVGNGSDEVLALCTRAFVENDGVVGYFEPSYSLYPVLADIRAVRKRPVALDDGFSWAMPEGYQASVFFMANPNAPTGMIHPREAVERFCRDFEGLVVIDEAYVDFASEDCLELARSCDNVLVVRTLSKSYSLAGLRLGFALGSRPLIDALYKIKDSYNVSELTQKLGLAALNDREHALRNITRIRATRKRLIELLVDLGYEVFPSEANFVWAKPPQPASEVFEALRRMNIVVRYFEGPRTGDYLRITVSTDAEIDALVGALEKYASRAGT